MLIGVDRHAGMACRDAAARAVDAAGQDGGKHGTGTATQGLRILGQRSARGERGDGVSPDRATAVIVAADRCRDADIVGTQGQDQQADQRRVVDRGREQCLVQCRGSELADQGLALLGDWGSRGLRLGGLVGGGLALGLRRRLCRAERDGTDLAGVRLQVVAYLVGLVLLLAMEPLCLGRQLGLTPLVEWQDDAVLGQTAVQPLLLGGEEFLDLGGIGVTP